MSHTPGPWSKEALWYLLRFGRKNSGPWDDACEDHEYMPDEEDAALIAAAPDLLAVADEVLATATVETPPHLVVMAEATIKKARGGK